MTEKPPYTIGKIRNSEKLIIVCPSPDGYKTRAARLVEAKGICGKYTNRHGGYMISATAAAKFEKLYAAGADASTFTREITQ